MGVIAQPHYVWGHSDHNYDPGSLTLLIRRVTDALYTAQEIRGKRLGGAHAMSVCQATTSRAYGTGGAAGLDDGQNGFPSPFNDKKVEVSKVRKISDLPHSWGECLVPGKAQLRHPVQQGASWCLILFF